MEKNDISIRQTLVADGLTVMEASSPKYHDRTVANAEWAAMTIAFAVDFSSPGERLTSRAAGERYLAVDIPRDRDTFLSHDYREKIAGMLAHGTENLGSFDLNIAGNALETLTSYGMTQADADDFVSEVIGMAMANGMSVREIRTGGQSGIDESGTKVALMYGIPASQIVPRGFLFNDARGIPHWNRQSFMSRFEGVQRRPVPIREFDPAQSIRQAQGEGRSEGIGFTLSMRSPLPGAIAGDILAAPYREKDADAGSFEFFRPSSFRSHGERVNRHCEPTDVSRLTLAVADWLMMGHHDEPGELRLRFPDTDALGSSGIAAALSVAGLYTDHMLEARDLARTGAMAFALKGEEARMCEACVMAVFMAAHGRDRNEIRFTMEQDYGIDLTAAMAGLYASEMLSQGRSLKDVSADLLQNNAVVIVKDVSEKRVEEGLSFYTIEEILPRTMQMSTETAYVNGEPLSYEVRTDRRSLDARDTLPLALASFMTSFTFEDAVRRAILAGGDSPSIAAMAGAMSSAYFGGIPKDMAARCMLTLDTSQKDSVNLFTAVSAPSRVKHHAQESVKTVTVYTVGGEKYSAMSPYDRSVNDALHKAGVNMLPYGELRQLLIDSKAFDRGTPFDDVSGGRRVLYVTPDGLRSATEVDLPGLPSREQRHKAREAFEQLSQYCDQVRTRMEHMVGYDDHGGRQPHLKFLTARYPSRQGDTIFIFDHSMVDGSISLDARNGLMKVDFGGELREGEYRDADWCREHALDPSRIATYSLDGFLPEDWRRDLGREGVHFGREEMVSLARLRKGSEAYTMDVDGLKSCIARACLDEGVGIHDLGRECNYDRLQKDIVEMTAAAEKKLRDMDSDAPRHRGMKI